VYLADSWSTLSALSHLNEWLQRLLARRPFNVAVVALPNKIARTVWALLAHVRTYQPGHVASAA
jgi:transposase